VVLVAKGLIVTEFWKINHFVVHKTITILSLAWHSLKQRMLFRYFLIVLCVYSILNLSLHKILNLVAAF